MSFSQQGLLPDSDDIFVDSVRKSTAVYMGSALKIGHAISEKGFFKSHVYDTKPLDVLIEGCRGVGHMNFVPDIDGIRRKFPLFIDFNGALIPQVSFLALCDYLGIDLSNITIKKGQYVELSPEIRIPIGKKGNTIVNFAGKWGDVAKHYSFVDVLKAYVDMEKGKKSRIDLRELEGKICIIGLTAVATHDVDATPLQQVYPMVGIHANLINMVLNKSFIARPDKLANIAILIFLALIVMLGVLTLRPLLSNLVTLLIYSALISASFMLFGFFNIWIDLFYPLLVILIVYIFCTFYKYLSELHKRVLVERELEIAQRIQRSFLKETPPEWEHLDMAVIMSPAKSVGGDLYDFVEMGDKRHGIMVGDVSGKGMPAALFMAKTVSEFRFHARIKDDSIKVITDLNNQISIESTSGLFVTLTYLVVDPEAMKLSIVDAGHLPIVYAGKDKETTLITATGGMAIGLMDGVEFLKQDVSIEPEDVFVLYTDGVTEARNMKKEEFEEDRLKEVVSKYKDLSAQDIKQAIYDELMKFVGKAPQHDDITIAVIKIK
ncbi:SpoIIE family protein phosphatase [Candidatus Omnitrophota bacterium]